MPLHAPKDKPSAVNGTVAFRKALALLGDGSAGITSNFPGVVRLVAADDIWLSPQYRQNTLVFSVIVSGNDAVAERVHRAVEQLALPLGGRVHWGKWSSVRTAQLRAMYPRLQDFIELRERLDPGRMFVNPYVERLLLDDGAR